MPYPDYDPNESFQLQSPFANGPDGGQGAPSMAFPSYSPPAPSSYPPSPEAEARQSAFDRVFGGGADISGGAPAEPAWNYQPGAGTAASPDRYWTDQPLVMDFSGGGDGASSAAPSQQAPPGLAPELGRMDAGQRRDASLAVNQSEGNYDTREALTRGGLAENKFQLARADQEAQEERRRFYDPAIEHALAVSKARTEELQNYKPADLWQNSNGGEREATIMTMVLGAASDMMTGRSGMPTAMAALNQAMASNKEREATRLDALVSKKRAAGENVAELQRQREQALVDIEHRSAAQWKTLQADAEAQIAAMAPGRQRDAAVQNAVKINQQAEDQEQKAQQAAANLAASRVREQLAQRKLHAGSGGPSDGSDGGPMDIRTVLNSQGQPIGMAPGTAKVSAEGKKARDMYASLQPVREGLEVLKQKVASTGTVDRFSGGLTDLQQEIKGISNMLVNPITQATGGGVAQEAEARRQLNTVSVNLTQNKDVALENINQLMNYVERMYDAKVRSLVPSATAEERAGSPSPSRAAPAPASGGAAPRKQGKDGNWYVRGPAGWQRE